MKYMIYAKQGILAWALIFGLTLIACNGKAQAQTVGGNADVRQAAEAVKGAVDAAGKAAAAVQGLAGGGKPAEASDFIYRLNAAKDGVIITGIQKDAKFGANLVVPAEIEGFPVVAYLAGSSHSDSAARERNQPPIVSVVFPDSITCLGSSREYDLDEKYGIKEFGDYYDGVSFANCSSLRSIVFPKNLKVLSGTFYQTPNLKMEGITWPEAMEVMSGDFNGNSFTELVIPEGVKIITGQAFSGSKTLTTVTIPDSIEVIRDYGVRGAFRDCPELTTVNVPAHPIAYSNNSEAFRNCPKLGIAAQKAIKDTGYTGTFR